MSSLRRNLLKPKLAEKQSVVGCFLTIPAPQIVEILGLAGFDFVIIDCEHGSIDLKDAEDLIRASHSTDISPIVRVAACDPIAIRQPLDMGAVGIHVPQIGTAELGERVVRSAMFHPRGERGMQPYVRGASFRAYDTATYLACANGELLTVIHIEGQEGIEDLDRILAVDGLDVMFMGPYDLSQSLGIPGQVKHPRVKQKMVEVVEKATRAGKIVGTYCDDARTAAEWRELGVAYLAVSLDTNFLLAGARSVVNELSA